MDSAANRGFEEFEEFGGFGGEAAPASEPVRGAGFVDGDLAVVFEAAAVAVRAAVEAAARADRPGDVLAAEREWEAMHRLVSGAQVHNLGRIDADALHRVDGHRSVKAHTRHRLKISPEEASRRHSAARGLRHLPEVAAALGSGSIGLDHVLVLARVQANPRIAGEVPAHQEQFLRWAREESFDEFKSRVLDWERTIDVDGGFRDNERNHHNRDFRFRHHSFEGTWEPSGQFAADQGARINEILAHYIDAEWQTDWAEARARLGDTATVADLARTDNQRRADAFMRLCNDAAGAPPGTTAPQIVHNIIWTADTYFALADLLETDTDQANLHWSASTTDPARRSTWCDPDNYRCSTLDGTPLEPVEQFFSSLANHVRRVVITANGVVIDLGRKTRLFTGSARHAAKLQSPRCVWPGCHHPTTRCEIDHLRDHAKGGATNPKNGAPLCGFHNRWKQKGFTINRDPITGRWRTYRPDGTPIP